ncbi:hypothetical protein [Pseudomonas sp. 18173]|uniref:hypothetical protein n=1 Tax=Pseudomonas sp. 18173 TaxID=3390055 RepID=UPI003D1E4AE8
MQIMCWVNKCRLALVFLILTFGASSNVIADVDLTWLESKQGRVQLKLAGGNVHELKLEPNVSGIFFDEGQHKIGERSFVSLFQVQPSNPGHSMGYCGAGSEVWFYVYEVADNALKEKTRVLVSSCLSSVSLASQNTGLATQDFDFSSVQWNSQGFSIAWFERVDAAGRSLTRTHFVLQDDDFLPHDVSTAKNQDK